MPASRNWLGPGRFPSPGRLPEDGLPARSRETSGRALVVYFGRSQPALSAHMPNTMVRSPRDTRRLRPLGDGGGLPPRAPRLGRRSLGSASTRGFPYATHPDRPRHGDPNPRRHQPSQSPAFRPCAANQVGSTAIRLGIPQRFCDGWDANPPVILAATAGSDRMARRASVRRPGTLHYTAFAEVAKPLVESNTTRRRPRRPATVFARVTIAHRTRPRVSDTRAMVPPQSRSNPAATSPPQGSGCLRGSG
jgi:hypothetical protein